MTRSRLWALAALLLAPALAATPPPPPVTYCAVQVYRDYTLGITYRALLIPDLDCEGVTRVRKASTINRAAPWRPVKPDGSAQYGGRWGWTVDSVPHRELWTTFTWEWNYYDGRQWVPAQAIP